MSKDGLNTEIIQEPLVTSLDPCNCQVADGEGAHDHGISVLGEVQDNHAASINHNSFIETSSGTLA